MLAKLEATLDAVIDITDGTVVKKAKGLRTVVRAYRRAAVVNVDLGWNIHAEIGGLEIAIDNHVKATNLVPK